jgi:hypothetical protein
MDLPPGIEAKDHREDKNGSTYGNRRVALAYFPAGNETWMIEGIEQVIVELEKAPNEYWLVPNNEGDDSSHPAVGPFENLTAAVVAVALLESS